MRGSVQRHTGFSLTELVVTLAVAMVLMAVGLPAFLRAYHSYELSTAAGQMADILRLTRYEAIRLNKPVDCIVQPASTAGMTNVWADSDRTGVLSPTEKMILLGPGGNLVDPGTVPNASGLISSAVGSMTATSPSPTSSVTWFDARGAVVPPTTVTAFYLGSTVAPEAGFRAVLLLPAGSIQIWSGDTGGNWQQQR